jgi:hypothetical protein
MKINSILFFTCILIFITSCSGIKLSDNCGKQSKETFIVLPFIADDYACNFEIENKIRNLCYNVENGMTLLNEYSHLVNKSYADIEITDFCDYAKTKGIDYVVIGTTRVEWYEGKKLNTAILEDYEYKNGLTTTGKDSNPKSLEMHVYNVVTGNYAIVDCYTINTSSKDKKELFHNYKVKKIQLGLPQ